jgi:hypothetical protein
MIDSSAKKSTHMYTSEASSAGTPQSLNSTAGTAGTPPLGGSVFSTNGASEAVGSPFKKQRPSLPGMDSAMLASPSAKASQQPQAGSDQPAKPMDDDDEEL